MAYNYFPAGYQPYQFQSNQSQQNNGILWVQGEGAAKSYPVAPNTSVPLWDSEANVIYIKSADMSGMPSIKILDYTIRDSQPQRAEIQPQEAFATKDDVVHLEDEIKALKEKLERMTERKEKSNVK